MICRKRIDASASLTYSIYTDHLNTPRLVANQSGQTVWRWDQQEPFGVNVADENPSGLGVFEFSMRFPGQYFDKETNLHYNYFRDFDPSLGIYEQSDPIGLDGGLNTYAYVTGYPIGLVDPLGLAEVPPILNPNTLVCRGGICTASQFLGGSGVTVTGSGLLQGVSVNSMNGKTLAQLACGIKNGQVGVTTVGQIQAMGGSIVSTPRPGNPYHATVSGISAVQAQALFGNTVPNPSKGLAPGSLGALGALSSILQFSSTSSCTQGQFSQCFCSLSVGMTGGNPTSCISPWGFD